MTSAAASAVLSRPFALGRGPWKTFDPFLFCVFHDDKFPQSTATSLGPDPKLLRGRELTSDFSYTDGWSMYHGTEVPGFPQHPHRGFETVTVPMTGVVDHFDSLGATGRYGEGDVQWLTTGNGIQHSEMFPLVNKDKPNPVELFQLWLNLPAKSKTSEPHFKMIWSPDVPTVAVGPDAKVTVIAGRGIAGATPLSPPPASWAADEKNDVAIWIIRIDKARGRVDIPAAAEGAGINRAVYYFRGKSKQVAITSASSEAGVPLALSHGVQLDSSKPLTFTSDDEGGAELLLLQGRPIGEPVVQHGPFVVNSKDELMMTFDMFRKTQFGGWPWPAPDYHHPREQKRFAKRPDGSIEQGPQ